VSKSSKRSSPDSGYVFGPDASNNAPGNLGGTPRALEGGVRGADSAETLPSLSSPSAKGRYERAIRTGAPVSVDVVDVEGPTGTDGCCGYGCPHHGCGVTAKTAHGLSRHIYSSHGGHGGVGKSINALMGR
jgi:hypothetical protein